MLSTPEVGWTDFSLPDIPTSYGLSYLTDIPNDWLDSAIYGLENLTPFCVHGFMEPNRMLCSVSFWNCHVLTEPDEPAATTEKDISYHISNTDMLTFCTYLHHNIRADLQQWVHWDDAGMDEEELQARQTKLTQKLERLEELLRTQARHFQKGHCFF